MCDGTHLAEARQLGWLLITAADLAQEAFAAIAQELGIPVACARVVCVLEQPIALSALASQLRCDKSYITPLAAQLEAAGWCERTATHDRRKKLLQLTAAGATKRTQLEAAIVARSPVLAALTAPERALLLVLLTKIVGTTVLHGPHANECVAQ